MNDAFLSNRLFEGLTPEVLRSVAIQEMEYQPGDLIFDEGTSGSTLMLVGSGRVQISKTGRQGLQETLATIEKNDFFGELAVIDHGPRSARAIALEPTLLGEVDHKTFTRLMNSAPDTLPLTFTRVVVQRLRYTNARYIEQLLQSERLTLLGTMVSSIVHDLNNPMSAILSSVDYLEKMAPSGFCAAVGRDHPVFGAPDRRDERRASWIRTGKGQYQAAGDLSAPINGTSGRGDIKPGPRFAGATGDPGD